MRVSIIVDVFRAFATASYVLERRPSRYILATQTAVIARLAAAFENPLLIGKPERGESQQIYTIPNSPTRTEEVVVEGREVLHRSDAGAKGVLLAKEADCVLAAGFGNAHATAAYVRSLKKPNISIFPMGYEGESASLEDDLCAELIESLLSGKRMYIEKYRSKLKEGAGHYFFTDDQWQYPKADFDRCLQVNRFPFAIQAQVKGDYAFLAPAITSFKDERVGAEVSTSTSRSRIPTPFHDS